MTDSYGHTTDLEIVLLHKLTTRGRSHNSLDESRECIVSTYYQRLLEKIVNVRHEVGVSIHVYDGADLCRCVCVCACVCECV